MADLPLQLPASVQIVDPKTGLATQTFLQLVAAIVRAVRDHDTRIDELEP
jgi:hypothetical protein